MQREKSFSGIGWLRSLAFFLLPASPERPQFTPTEFYLFSNCLFGGKKKGGGVYSFLFVHFAHGVETIHTDMESSCTGLSMHALTGTCLKSLRIKTHTHAHVFILFKDKGKDEERLAPCGCWLCAELAAASQGQRGQDGKQLLCLPAPSRRYNAGRIRAKRIKSQHRNFYCRYRLQIADQHACVALGPVLPLSLVMGQMSRIAVNSIQNEPCLRTVSPMCFLGE